MVWLGTSLQTQVFLSQLSNSHFCETPETPCAPEVCTLIQCCNRDGAVCGDVGGPVRGDVIVAVIIACRGHKQHALA